MFNYNRGKQHSYSIFLTPEQAQQLSEMIREAAPKPNAHAYDAAVRIEVKRKVNVLINAIKTRESRSNV
jgi:hypothetical protein